MWKAKEFVSSYICLSPGGGPSLVVRAQDDDLEEDLAEGEEDLDATVETESDDGAASDTVLADSDAAQVRL